MDKVSLDDVYSLVKPSTPYSFYGDPQNDLTLTNTEDDNYARTTSIPLEYDEGENESSMKGAWSTSNRKGKGKKRSQQTSGVLYTSYSSSPLVNKRKRLSLATLEAMVNPDSIIHDDALENCKDYIKRCREHLPQIMSDDEHQNLKMKIDQKVMNRVYKLIMNIRDDISKESSEVLAFIVPVLNGDNDIDDAITMMNTIKPIGEGLEFGQAVHVIPELATPEMRKNIPRQDGKPGPANDPEDHWGSDYWDNVVDRKKKEEKDIPANFTRLVSGRMGREMSALIDNSHQRQIDSDIEAQKRLQRAQIDTLGKRLKSLLAQYEKVTAIEVEVTTTQAAVGEKTTIGTEASDILRDYSKLHPAETSIAEIVLLEKLRTTGVRLFELYETIFTEIQKLSGFSNPKETVVEYEIPSQWIDAILGELIIRELRSSGSGLSTPSVSEWNRTRDYERSIGSRGLRKSYPIDSRNITDNFELVGQELVKNTLTGLRFLSSNVSDYILGEKLANFLLAFAEDARYDLIQMSKGIEGANDDNLMKYVKFMKIAIFIVFGAFIREAQVNIQASLMARKRDANWLPTKVNAFFSKVDEANISPSEEAIDDISLDDGLDMLFGIWDDPGITKPNASPLEVYNSITEPSNSYIPVTDEFIVPESPFKERLDNLIDRTIDLLDRTASSDVDEIKEERDVIETTYKGREELKLTKLYNLFLKLQPRLTAVISLLPSPLERERLEESVINVKNKLEVIRRSIKNVIDQLSKIVPKYRHTAAYASRADNSGILIPTPSLQYAIAKAFTIVQEYLPDVAKAGLARLESDKEVVAYFVDLVASCILEAETDFSRQWTQKERMEKAKILKMDSFLELAKRTWTRSGWIYGEQVLTNRRSAGSSIALMGSGFPPVMGSFMYSYKDAKGPGFY